MKTANQHVKTTRQLLVEARALISDPNNWTKQAYARNAEGEKVNISHGCKFCSMGALRKAHEGEQFSLHYHMAINALDRQLVVADIFPDVVMFNDDSTTTHEKVLEMFDKAIEAQPAP